MNKQIVLTTQERKRIMKEFKTSRTTLWAALNYQSDSPFARMLRKVAIERGGIECEKEQMEPKDKNKISDCSANTDMTVQYFGENIKLITYSATNQTGFFVDGELREIYKDLTPEELKKLHSEAELLSKANR